MKIFDIGLAICWGVLAIMAFAGLYDPQPWVYGLACTCLCTEFIGKAMGD